MSRVIPVFYACDNKYVKYTIVSIKSLIDHVSRENEYRIYVLNSDIDEENWGKLKRLETENVSIISADITDYMEEIESKMPLRDYYSSTTYFRLYIPIMFPEYSKVIYIDSDTIVLADVAELYSHHLGQNYVAAVRDQVILQEQLFTEYVEQVLGMEHDAYFNAGMLLMNTRAFREDDLLSDFIELLQTYTFVVAQDQDYLNLICRDHVLWLEPGWNMEVFGEFPCEEKDFKIIHYNLAEKPWNYPDCRLAIHFWTYAKQTECYDEISDGMKSYTQEQRKKDELSGKNLENLAISEINNEDNYFRMMTRQMEGKSGDRLAVLEKIAQYEKEGRFHEDVEEDPPAPVLMPEDINYLSHSLRSKMQTAYAFRIAHWFSSAMQLRKKFIMKDIVGIENWRKLHSGAIITCNHFNAMDSFAIHIAYDKSWHKFRKFYRVIREGNYTGFPGFYGYLMRHCNTIPLSSNFKTMEKMISAVDKILTKGHFILVYPEQSMWWNYRKPKPLTKGAFTFATRANVPVLPCFITMEDSEYLDDDGFKVQEYTVHIAEPIYPNPFMSRAENVAYLKQKNYEIWKEIYEETYGIPLEYTTPPEKLKL